MIANSFRTKNEPEPLIEPTVNEEEGLVAYIEGNNEE